VLCGAALVLVSTIVLLMCCQCVANELLWVCYAELG